MEVGSGLLTIQEVAKILGIKVNTLYGWINLRKIPFIKCGRLVRFRREDINHWLNEHKVSVDEVWNG